MAVNEIEGFFEDKSSISDSEFSLSLSLSLIMLYTTVQICE